MIQNQIHQDNERYRQRAKRLMELAADVEKLVDELKKDGWPEPTCRVDTYNGLINVSFDRGHVFDLAFGLDRPHALSYRRYQQEQVHYTTFADLKKVMHDWHKEPPPVRNGNTSQLPML